MEKTAAFYAGFEAKMIEITEMGFNAARDKFNADYPAPYTGGKTAEANQYADGEWAALCSKLG